MWKIIIKNFEQNKKTNFVFFLSIVLASMLIFVIILLFSVAYKYILDIIVENNGDYHVKIKTDLQDYENFAVIKHVKWQDDAVLITYNNIYDVYILTDKLCEKAKCSDIVYNDAYLSLYGVSKNENFLLTLKYLILIILTIVLISTILIIYNVYKILLISKYPQIAILQSVGMTVKELRVMLLMEALIFSFSGIIGGFILSLLSILFLLTLINHMLNINMYFTVNLRFLIYAFIFLLGLILFICLIPLFKAKQISYLKLLNINYTYKKSKKFNNIIAFLAYLNYKRSKGHYKSVIISLVVFMLLASTFNMFLQYGQTIINNYVQMPTYDAEISIANNTDESYKLLKNFAQKNARKYKIYETCQTKVNVDSENYVNKGPSSLNVYMVQGNNYFINYTSTIINKNDKIYKENKSYFNDIITLNINNHTLKLVASNNIPFGYENLLTKDNLIIGVNNLEDVCSPHLTLFMESKTDNLEKSLKKLLQEDVDLYYVNTQAGKQMVNNLILSIKVGLYSLLSLVLLIGVATISSSTFLSMQVRKKEIGLLKSIGLLDKEFREMIVLESLYITLCAVLWTLPLVLFISFITNKVMNAVIDLETVNFLKPFLWTVLISMLMTRFVMRLVYRKMGKSSILNLLSHDNV